MSKPPRRQITGRSPSPRRPPRPGATKAAPPPKVEKPPLRLEQSLRVISSDDVTTEPGAKAPVAPSSTCAWQDCDEPRRTTSKYCSRGCSNKNARNRSK
jgi:hypothetical protein